MTSIGSQELYDSGSPAIGSSAHSKSTGASGVLAGCETNAKVAVGLTWFAGGAVWIVVVGTAVGVLSTTANGERLEISAQRTLPLSVTVTSTQSEPSWCSRRAPSAMPLYGMQSVTGSPKTAVVEMS